MTVQPSERAAEAKTTWEVSGQLHLLLSLHLPLVHAQTGSKLIQSDKPPTWRR